MDMTNDLRRIAATNATNEITEHFTYARLARMENNPANRAALEKLSAQEQSHYEFWKSLLAHEDPRAAERIRPRMAVVWMMAGLRTFLGVTFITKFLEIHEKGAVAKYEAARAIVPAEHQARFNEIIEDEKSHERTFIAELKEARVSYMGFIVLGLADAIVEITGVHAGFLGVTGDTLIAGVAGVIVGFAAAISMGSAAYLQAKEDPEKSPIVSAFATGISYFVSVILLALPYFLIRTMIPAFTLSTSIGILLIAGFTYYGAVVFDRGFWREFGEAAGLMLATAVATFFWGAIIGKIFHINPASF
jgi:VIT1/CCC1 family predicted Fe2+/Mn2+ transporter